MKNMHNIVSDVLAEIRANHRIRESVDYNENERIWNIELRLGISRFDIELYMDGENVSAGGVLRCVGFSDRFQTRFMDTLMNKLELT